MRLAALTALAAVTLVATPGAAAKTIPTRWNEYLRVNGRVLMTFNTRAITINGAAWAVSGSFKNNTRQVVRVVAQEPGLAAHRRRPGRGVPYTYLRPTAITPPLPAELAPGQVWRGTFSGRGMPSWTRYIAVVYGDFNRIAPGLPARWQWITDHWIRRP